MSTRSLTDRLLDGVERAGNRLPDPVNLFLILIAILFVISFAAALGGASVVHPNTKATVPVVNLLSADQIRRWLAEMPTIFAAFPPLGMVLVAMVGVGFAEKTGYIGAALSAFVQAMPRWTLTTTIVFAGIMSNLASDAGYVILIPLAAALFAGAGRHPIAGLAAAFAAVSGGYSANLLIGSLDALLAGITQTAARLIEPTITITIAANWYLMAALVPLYTAIGVWLTDRVIEPRLGPWKPEAGAGDIPEVAALSETQRRGVRLASWTFLGMWVVILWGVVPKEPFAGTMLSFLDSILPPSGFMYDQKGSLDQFYHALVALLSITFLISGLIYGRITGAFRSEKEAVRMASGTMADLAYYILLVLAVSQFIKLFEWSNLGIWSAVNSAAALQAAGITGSVLVVAFLLLSAFVNLFIGSASAKWALMAPIFVPAFMLLGMSPEAAQGLYRIGDSFTNVITPMTTYFALVIVFGQKYARDFGIGSLIAVMLPYALWFGVGSTILCLGWYWLDLPLGPGVGMLYPPR
ncbi:MAG TPA: AbgT family transporter [Azospirillaceae bacterium]|nr:AbgT family transporter [Azospirillaceae bacterium]